MIQSSARVTQRSGDVLWLEIRQLLEDLGLGQSGGEQIEDVGDPNAHSSNAGTSTALLGIDRDALEKVGHEGPLVGS